MGYNDPNLIPDNVSESNNKRIFSLGYDHSFANNCNVMMICEVSVLFISGMLYLISRKKR